MSAHDQLEQHLRRSVAGRRTRRQRLPDARLLMTAGTVLVTVAVLVMVTVLATGSESRRPVFGQHSDTIVGPVRERSPHLGKPGRDVDQRAITNAFSVAFAKNAVCDPLGAPLGQAPRVTQATLPAGTAAELPVLQRGSRSASLPLVILKEARFIQGTIYARYVHIARTVDGISYWIVPVRGVGHPALSAMVAVRCDADEVFALTAQLRRVPVADRAATSRYGDAEFMQQSVAAQRSTLHDGIYLFTTGRQSGTGGGLSPSQLDRIGMISYYGTAHGGVYQIDGVLPGRVARVQFDFPLTRAQGPHDPMRVVSVNVTNDVFVARIPKALGHRRLTYMLWLNARGRVIRRIDESRSGA